MSARAARAALGALLGAALWLQALASLHCAQRREISPCSCRRQELGSLLLACERLDSFARAAAALQGRFAADTAVTLAVSHSAVSDLADHPIAGLGLSVVNLKLNYDNISMLNDAAFEGLMSTEYLSLADNSLPSVPCHVLRHMPNIRTLDLGRNKIKTIGSTDFKDIPNLQHLVLPGNGLTMLEKNCLPSNLRHVHLGVNQLTSLNNTLRNMDGLEWLFINANKLTSIDNEIPMNANKMTLIHAANNQLERLPVELRNLPRIDSLYFYNNNIDGLHGALQKSKRLQKINLSYNKIKELAYDDFTETDVLAYLDLGYNEIHSLNGSLTHLRMLQCLNLTHNELSEFSLKEIKGLKKLWVIDLSYNQITHLSGHTENLVELETHVLELRLEHNLLHSLGGALMGLHGLLRLNVSHNRLKIISPDDLISLDELRLLDVSHNQITTLEETSKTYLPALEELLASHNNITFLDKDFHGLPVLCWADLSWNSIRAVNLDLVTKTKCSIHGVTGSLKIYLHDNPVLCDENYSDLVSNMDRLHTRMLGECLHKNEFITSAPVGVMVAPTLLNDIMAAPPAQPAPPGPPGSPAPLALPTPPASVARYEPLLLEPEPAPETLPAHRVLQRE